MQLPAVGKYALVARTRELRPCCARNPKLEDCLPRSRSSPRKETYPDSAYFLQGVPELVLSMSNSRMLDDISLHPCVRLKRWEQERILSFVPPDGKFRLMEFHVEGGQVRSALFFDWPPAAPASSALSPVENVVLRMYCPSDWNRCRKH